MNFETAMDRLEAIVDQMESGKMQLEELIVRYEEGVLESIFGSSYLAYKSRTPRWIPRPPSGERESGPHDWREAARSETSTFMAYAVLVIAFALKHRYLK